jgi:hypothetical protein
MKYDGKFMLKRWHGAARFGSVRCLYGGPGRRISAFQHINYQES